MEVTRVKRAAARPPEFICKATRKQARLVELWVKSDLRWFKNSYGFDLSGWDVRAHFDSDDIVRVDYRRPGTVNSIWVARRISTGFIQLGFGPETHDG